MSERRPQPVALVTAPARIGGLESAVSTLATGLAGRGVPVVVVQLLLPGAPGADAFASLADRGIELVTVRAAGRSYRAAARAVAQVVRSRGVRVVHSHGERADLVSRLARSPGMALMSTVHGFVVNTAKGRLVKWLHLRLLSGFDGVVAVSAPLARELARTLAPARVHAVPNAMGAAALVPPWQARERLGLGAVTGPVVGWIGRFSPEKAPELFVQAFAQVPQPNLRAVMVGDGPLLASCRAASEALRLGDRCAFPGAVPAAGTLFPALDLFVLTSRTEGTPITVLEAMRAGVPVVATAVGGVPELLAGGAGWLVPTGDARAIGSAIDAALSDPVECARRAARALARVEADFGLAAWIDRHLVLYGEAVAGTAAIR